MIYVLFFIIDIVLIFAGAKVTSVLYDWHILELTGYAIGYWTILKIEVFWSWFTFRARGPIGNDQGEILKASIMITCERIFAIGIFLLLGYLLK